MANNKKVWDEVAYVSNEKLNYKEERQYSVIAPQVRQGPQSGGIYPFPG